MSDTVQAPSPTVRSTPPGGDDILQRVKAEFLEMPGLRLTEAQARRLWGLDPTLCASLLTTLVETNFLFRASDGSVMRVDRARSLRARPTTPDSGRSAA